MPTAICDIKSLTFEELKEFMATLGEKPFRAGQIFAWLHRGVSSFDEMTDISKALRDKLKETAYISVPTVLRKQVSSDGETVKFLFELADKNCVETVVMHYQRGYSVCVSSQVGCRMGCAFCASTIGGVVRNLSAGEILDQLLFAGKELGCTIDHVVLMGMGEPLDNLEAVISFLKNVNDPHGLHLSLRNISLSTCGVVPGLAVLADHGFPLTLSISLHAPNNALRDTLMPINRRYPLDTLLDACRAYFDKTGRRISFEYILIDGVNDQPQHARELANILRGILCHVNLIPCNPVDGKPYRPPQRAVVDRFSDLLTRAGVQVTVRRKMGRDIDAACGQLRKRQLDTERKTKE